MKWIKPCLGILTFLLVPPSISAAEPTDCSVRLLTTKSEGGRVSVGTGSYVYLNVRGPRFIVTAYHCVRDNKAITIEANEKGALQYQLNNLVEPTFLCVPALDICVFKVTQHGEKTLAECGRRAAKLSDQELTSATHVVAVGNPVVVLTGSEKYPFGWVSGATVTQKGSFGQRIGDTLAEGEAKETSVVLLESLQITFGFSGGPILRSATNFLKDDREVVGVLLGGDPRNGKISWCVPSHEVIKCVSAESALWEQYPPTTWKASLFKAEAFRRSDEKLLLGFPLKFEPDYDVLDKVKGWRMKTNITISDTGRLDATTRTWTTTLAGFNGEVVVFLADASGNILWRTRDRHKYGLDLINTDRTEKWDEFVPADVLARVSKVLVHHQNSPKSIEDVLGLTTVKLDESEVRILKDLAKAIDIKWEAKTRSTFMSITASAISVPSFVEAADPSKVVCLPIKGTQVEILESKNDPAIQVMRWHRVRILTGEFKGKEGWVSATNIEER